MGKTPTKDIQATKEQLLANAAKADKVAHTVLVQMAVEQVYIDAGLETWTMKYRLQLMKIRWQCKGMLLTGRMARGFVHVLDEMEIYENAPEYLGEKR